MDPRKEPVTIVKIGGNVIDDESQLSAFLDRFAGLPGAKVLIHGGGKLATNLATKLGIPQTMVQGRRVTDAETLKIVSMVYSGWINKNLVASLFARGCHSIGATGADADLIRARKRAPVQVDGQAVDYGFVGDVVHVREDLFTRWLNGGVTPVIAPITHDGKGQLLNTNADTIANEIASTLARTFEVSLVFCFEKPGVLLDVNDPKSVISQIDPTSFQALKTEGKVFEGMIPKLENACKAVQRGVKRVVLGQAQDLHRLSNGTGGTTVSAGGGR